MKNTIAGVKKQAVNGPNGPATAMMIAIDMLDPSTLKVFAIEVGERFVTEMLISPENTNMMLITIIGDCTALQFKKEWDALSSSDPVIKLYMDKMLIADVLHGTSEGKVLDQVSLIHS